MVVDGETSWNNFGVTIVTLSTEVVIPEEVSLSSAYPNPFNPTTMLSFSVAEEMDVAVTVYDMMGRVVSELASGMYEPGNHELRWDASEQSSGIYFVKMIAGEYSHTQKLMLVK